MYPQKNIILSSSPLQENGEFLNFEHDMYLGGQIRMEAAVHLAQSQVDSEFIIVGGYNRDGEGDVRVSNKANDMTVYVRDRAPHANIRTIYSLPCTHHNFVAIFIDWQQRDEHVETVGVLTNEYHMPRALEFAEQAAVDMGISVEFVPVVAEEVLGKDINAIIGDDKQAYERRLQSEEQGLLQLRDGSYQDSCLTKHAGRLSYVLSERGRQLLTKSEMQILNT